MRPLQVGDELHGYCEGEFGRDYYECGYVEAIGRDWLILRTLSGQATGAFGAGILQRLAKYRDRKGIPHLHGMPCEMPGA